MKVDHMQTNILPANDPRTIKHAVQLLAGGQVISFPTDTVYGIGVGAFDHEAVIQIYTLKQRSRAKAIPILIPEAGEMKRVADNIPAEAWALARTFGQGA